jgi:hypothetical protein
LQAVVAEKRGQIEEMIRRGRAELHSRQLLGSREWSFCLYPADVLAGRLLELFPPNPYA